MKHYILSAALILCVPALHAQHENHIGVDTKVESVTVYLSGAELSAGKNVSLTKGLNRIVFLNLSSSLQEKSVRATVKGDVSIMSVSTETNYLKDEQPDASVSMMMDSLNRMREGLVLLHDQLDAWAAEKNVLASNRDIGGTQAGVSVLELQKVAEFHRTRTLQINRAMTEIRRNIGLREKLLRNTEYQFQQMHYTASDPGKEVHILVHSNAAQTVSASLTFLCNNAGWAPAYDIITRDVNSKVELKYKASVVNNTDMSWKDARLKLSTADPRLTALKPQLIPWSLNYNTRLSEGYFEKNSIGYFDKRTDSTGSSQGTIEVGELSTEFAINRTYDIKPDNKLYTVEISSHSLNATFQYIAIPKLDKDAFLTARIGDWEKLNLIDGPANIYFGDAYVGESRIETRMVEDSLELSMGRDNQILVTRAKRQDLSSKKLLGTNRSEEMLYEIVVKNNRKVPVTVEVLDQVPIPLESDITVDLTERSGATLDAQSGKLTWLVKLNPGESVMYKLAFTVKYPKGKKLDMTTPRITPRFL